MRYERPELAERLAADYALGVMPARARRRFERAVAANATLAAAVAGWSERLAPLDTITAAEAPPARVWRAIVQRIGPAAATPARTPPRAGRFIVWRGLGALALAACAAVVIYVSVQPTPSATVAELAGKVGLSNVVVSARRMPDIGLSTMALGVSERERPRWIRAALLLTGDALPVIGAAPPPAK
jgi:anti-sigma-K factor RskA